MPPCWRAPAAPPLPRSFQATSARCSPAVHQADAELGKGPRQPFRHRGRRLEVGALRLLDHGIDHVGLPPGRALAPDETVDLVPRALRAERRLDAPPPRGPLA